RVVVVACSTGAPLAVLAALQGAGADGYVFVSPNFRVRGRGARLLDLGFAATWVPWVAPAERGFRPLNDDQARFWTPRYPTRAVLAMAAVARAGRRAPVGRIAAPLLALFDDADRI